MKIRKGEFRAKSSKTASIEEHIEKVIQPFTPQIESRQIHVLISKNFVYPFSKVEADWIMYQLILFSIIQNAIKYNQF